MTSTKDRPRSVVVEIKRTIDTPWWWDHIHRDALGCEVVYRPIVLKNGRPKGVVSIRFIVLLAQCIQALWQARNRDFGYIYTVECDWSSFIIAGLQTVLRLRRPRHVILQFIMREKTATFGSRLKYAFMRWCFSSVDSFVCSSRAECHYYAKVFRWPQEKFPFVTLLTDPGYLELFDESDEPFVLSAGRTFRDYPTLLQAFSKLSAYLVVVVSQGGIDTTKAPPNVAFHYDLPLHALSNLIRRATAVVIPLEDRQISIGQSVMLQAMAMGKAVIATRVNGTEDYIEHMRTGLLVPPNDAEALRTAVESILVDTNLRERIGTAARAQIQTQHLPHHYARGVLRAVMARAHGAKGAALDH